MTTKDKQRNIIKANQFDALVFGEHFLKLGFPRKGEDSIALPPWSTEKKFDNGKLLIELLGEALGRIMTDSEKASPVTRKTIQELIALIDGDYFFADGLGANIVDRLELREDPAHKTRIQTLFGSKSLADVARLSFEPLKMLAQESDESLGFEVNQWGNDSRQLIDENDELARRIGEQIVDTFALQKDSSGNDKGRFKTQQGSKSVMGLARLLSALLADSPQRGMNTAERSHNRGLLVVELFKLVVDPDYSDRYSTALGAKKAEGIALMAQSIIDSLVEP